MIDICTYQLEVQGQLDESDLNTASPIQMKVVRMDESATHLTVCTDQSGLIGLMRHLHARGLVLVSIHSDRSSPVVSQPDFDANHQ